MIQGKKHTEETKKKMSLAKKGKMPKNIEMIKNYWKGKHHSEETKNKISIGHKGLTTWNKDKPFLAIRGKNHWNWKGGLSKRKRKDERNDSAYNCWVLSIKKRDNWKCKINNQDCSGYCMVHHILSWRDFPELRYNINNGITLCQAHHPRKRVEEKRLVPFFQELVPVLNELI